MSASGEKEEEFFDCLEEPTKCSSEELFHETNLEEVVAGGSATSPEDVAPADPLEVDEVHLQELEMLMTDSEKEVWFSSVV